MSYNKYIIKNTRRAKPMYHYFFHIIDVEFDDEYDYDEYFEDHEVAAKFIEENEEVGNTVICVSPYYVWTEDVPKRMP